jgi:hypothetical protein
VATFQEFYCDAAGANSASNLNAGDKTTAPATTTNGAYTRSGGAGGGTSDLFVAASGTPFAGVAVGDYVSIYADGGSAPTGYIARISAKNSSTSIDVDSAKSAGTRPATAATGVTARVGGAWLGPNGASGFPFGFIAGTATDGSGNPFRVNFKAGTNYAVTAAVSHNKDGPGTFEGMTAAPGDGGRAVFDGGTSGASYTLLTVTSAVSVTTFRGLTFQNNGATSNADLAACAGNPCFWERCVFASARGAGLDCTGGNRLTECEAYSCGQSNSSGNAGFTGNTVCTFVRCVSHDNAGSNVSGWAWRSAGPVTCTECIADTNGQDGFRSDQPDMYLRECDSYNNGRDGARFGNSTAHLYTVESCNFVKNGGYGVNGTGAGVRVGTVTNCGFGSGTQANTSGTTTGLSAMVETGSVTYASGVTPWADPANGDFRVSLAAAKGAGRGTFTQTQASYTGAVAYPDIGSCQHLDAGGGSRIIGG